MKLILNFPFIPKIIASTVQILGAEKALFKALKTKHDTPKYGLIYHAQVVGQASAPLKVNIYFSKHYIYQIIYIYLFFTIILFTFIG